jgi:hypothetical protein
MAPVAPSAGARPTVFDEKKQLLSQGVIVIPSLFFSTDG